MPIAIFNGIVTSILFETILLSRNMKFKEALKTATGMSLISMISMELAMNFTDIILEGALVLSLSSIIPVLVVGFIVPWPYNYWRLVKYNKGCCG
jgi:asparagine N-glycosylation enzyme membrane subunit Stt3